MYIRNSRETWLTTLLLLPALVAAALFGFVIFLVVLGAAMVAILVIMARLWWLNRKLRKTPGKGALEGEFVVIEETRRSDEKPGD